MRTPRPLDADMFRAAIAELEGKSAAIVYSFRAQESPERIWYDQWRSNVIAAYGSALEALGVEPYYVDVESFCRQAFSGALPDLHCVFNLNAGIAPIAHWALVPSVAAWCGLRPLPAEADVLIVGERKDTAALVAQSCGLRTPRIFRFDEIASLAPADLLVAKPRDLGGSVGVRLISAAELITKQAQPGGQLVQEFVRGFDLTVPLVFQPSAGRHRAVCGVVYVPECARSDEWIHDEGSKRSGQGYRKQVVPLPLSLEEALCRFATVAELGPYARVDLRIAASGPPDSPEFWNGEPYFIEVNPLPTLRPGINFLNVVSSDYFTDAFRVEFDGIRDVVSGREMELPLALVLGIAMATL